MDELIGKQLGLYNVVAQIETGGMANIYKAHQPSINRDVAVKVLIRQNTKDYQRFTERFMQEAQIVAKLEHPHILPVYDFGETDDYLYLVMRLVETGTLHDRFHGQPFPLEQIRQVIIQMGDALDYAHSQGVIHRDIKPKNILMDDRDNCMLTDFGIAKMADIDLGLTQVGTTVGTPTYMSPEQIQGEELDGRSDIYALGVLLYQLATGHLPYQAETPHEVAAQHLYAELPSARKANPNIPKSLEAIIVKALAKSPDARYAQAGDMVKAIKAVSLAAPVFGPENYDNESTDILTPTDLEKIEASRLETPPPAAVQLREDVDQPAATHDESPLSDQPQIEADAPAQGETAAAGPASSETLPQNGATADALSNPEPAADDSTQLISAPIEAATDSNPSVPVQQTGQVSSTAAAPAGGTAPSNTEPRNITPEPFDTAGSMPVHTSVWQGRGLVIISIIGITLIVLLGVLIGLSLNGPSSQPVDEAEVAADENETETEPAESSKSIDEATPLPVPMPSENLQLALNFDETDLEAQEGNELLPKVDENGITKGYDNGKYIIQIEPAKVEKSGDEVDPKVVAQQLVDNQIYDDFVLQVNMSELEKSQNGAYGVTLRNLGEELAAFYSFEILSDGSYVFNKTSEEKTIAFQGDINSFEVGQNINLRIEAVGSSFVIFIDKEEIGKFTDPDEDYLKQGGISLRVSASRETDMAGAAFDNLKIWSVEAPAE